MFTAWISIRIIAWLALAQGGQSPLSELNLPYGPTTQLISPNGSQILYGVPYQKGVNDGPQLWIENVGTHDRRMLLSIGGTLSAVWSSDGSAFSVQDHYASDSARTYIYDAHTLQRLDLAGRILAVDPGTERFANGHAYFRFGALGDLPPSSYSVARPYRPSAGCLF